MSIDRRRRFVVLGFALSVLAASVAIRLAAGWTASAATLAERPPDATQLVAQLQQEQARAAALAEELAGVSSQAAELQAALDAARQKAGTDAASAEELARQLKDARARLTTLQAQLAARPPTTVILSRPAPSTPTSGAEEQETDEHEDDEEHDD
jgi:DNA repair exonuclease SbcCD ATPase subunit